MIHASRIDKASAFFFATAFVLAKAQYFSLPLIAGILNLVSLILYLIGYILWALAATLFPLHKRKFPTLLGFTDFQQPYLHAAIFGFIATFYCFMAMSSPVLIIPATWIYFVSNMIWCLSEYHKLLYPPGWNQAYPDEKQRNQLIYTSLVSAITLLSAISITIAFCLPLLAPQILIASMTLGAILGAIALGFWLAYYISEPPKKRLSYHKILTSLDLENHKVPGLEKVIQLESVSERTPLKSEIVAEPPYSKEAVCTFEAMEEDDSVFSVRLC